MTLNFLIGRTYRISRVLLHGVECIEVSEKSYKQRIEEHLKPAIAIIESKFKDVDENEKITALIYNM